ncbi:MAG: Hemin uptake protein hemP [Verrucomicrobiaceae bacterium]|nr:Hemin uptake protein hemP [Verrucomicrobiaceae bacterium]
MKTDAYVMSAASQPLSQPLENSIPHGVQLCSRDLFRHANTVRIEHNGEHYWLRLTRGNKLILTK